MRAELVCIGNGAWDQRQHDVWAVPLDSVDLARRAPVIGWTHGNRRCCLPGRGGHRALERT